MKNINEITIAGYQAGEARLNEVGGKSVLNVPILVNEYMGKDENGNKREKVTRFDVSFWGERADKIAPIFVKRDGKYQAFTIIGKLQQDKPWTDNEGNARRTPSIIADEFFFGGIGINRAEVLGNVGQDVVLRYTQAGVPVATFSVASSESWKNQNGEWQERTTWFRVTAWRGLAEYVNDAVTKGKPVLVKGSYEYSDPYVNNNGEARVSLEIRAHKVIPLVKSQSESTDYGDPMADFAGDFGGNNSNAPEELDDIPF